MQVGRQTSGVSRMPTKPKDGKRSTHAARTPEAALNYFVLNSDKIEKQPDQITADDESSKLANASQIASADARELTSKAQSSQIKSIEAIVFIFDAKKCIEAIHFLAMHARGVPLTHLGRILFLAESEHLLDWGRPIFGDSYRAVDQQPVPVNTFALINNGLSKPGEISDLFSAWIHVRTHNTEIDLFPKYVALAQKRLSKSDEEALLSALRQSQTMSPEAFDEIFSQVFSSVGESANKKPNNASSLSLYLNDEQIEYISQTSTVKRGLPD